MTDLDTPHLDTPHLDRPHLDTPHLDRPQRRRSADVVVVGGGIVGACCADALAAAGRSVVVVERRSLAGGTTAAGEGNILVSDKLPGPELDLALCSNRLWRELADSLDADIELDPKGGLVVAATDDGLAGLHRLAAQQREAGVDVELVDVAGMHALEPHLTTQLAGGALYPQDLQVQPVLASAQLLRRARANGAELRDGVEVIAIDRDRDGRIQRVRTDAGSIDTPTVVNATGAWSDALARLAGVDLPVRPRRGHILVTEPLPPLVNRKVYDADYVGTLGAATAPLQVSSVIEGTAGGTILIGSSREHVGFDRTTNLAALAAMAARAISLFPVLAGARVMRSYLGFRPWTPDHLPIIGEDPRVAGLWHATGHEGAGIGLAPVTAALITAGITGGTPPVDPTPLRCGRPSLTGVGSDTTRTEDAHAR